MARVTGKFSVVSFRMTNRSSFNLDFPQMRQLEKAQKLCNENITADTEILKKLFTVPILMLIFIIFSSFPFLNLLCSLNTKSTEKMVNPSRSNYGNDDTLLTVTYPILNPFPFKNLKLWFFPFLNKIFL